MNDLYAQLNEFWNKIFLILVFHFAFAWIYKCIFGVFPVKLRLEKYLESERFARTKKILKDFELWGKLPFLLFFIFLIYLTLFNSLANVTTSLKIFPLRMQYSTQAFISEYEPKEDIQYIASYASDSTLRLNGIEAMKNSFLNEYKISKPDQYAVWVQWLNKQFLTRMRTLQLSVLLLMTLTVLVVRHLIRKKGKTRTILLRYLGVLILSLPILFYMRFRAEQSIEQKYSNEVYFVKNSLIGDQTKRVTLSNKTIAWMNRRIDAWRFIQSGNYSFCWVSQWVENSSLLTFILGDRKLKTAKSGRYDAGIKK